MDKKTVLVTGANKGIGLEIVRQLVRRDFYVFLTARDEDRGKKALNEIKNKAGDTVAFLRLDVSDMESIKSAVNELDKKIEQLDVLINNAGIMIDRSDITEMSVRTFEETLHTNTIGPIVLTQLLLPMMKDGGRIINMSSDLGALHHMGGYKPAYSVSKTALNAVTRQFASALQNRNIAVNTVSPGWVRTDMGGSGAPLGLKEGADTAVWLATEAPQELTGGFFRDRTQIEW